VETMMMNYDDKGMNNGFSYANSISFGLWSELSADSSEEGGNDTIQLDFYTKFCMSKMKK